MTFTEMLEQSGFLTILGMSVVFIFLWIIVVCVNIIAKLIHRMGWDKDIEQQKNELPKKAGKAASPDVVAAITAAVTKYQGKE